MYLDNKYTRIYYALVAKATSRNFKTRKEAKSALRYVERHHIIPSSLGGSDDGLNLIFLTAREHFIAHWLLTKMTTGSNRFSMLHALWCMRRKCKKQDRYSTKITAGVYARLKVERSKMLSISMTGEGNHMFGKTGKLSPCYGRTGDKHPLFGIAPTPESNKKRSEKLSGVPKSEESNKKRSKSHKGKPHDYQRGENNQCFTQLKNGNHPSQIKKTCVHCGKTVSINAFAKWHDANCIVVKQRVSSIKKKCPHCDTLAAASQYTRYHGDKCKKNITYTDL